MLKMDSMVSSAKCFMRRIPTSVTTQTTAPLCAGVVFKQQRHYVQVLYSSNSAILYWCCMKLTCEIKTDEMYPNLPWY